MNLIFLSSFIRYAFCINSKLEECLLYKTDIERAKTLPMEEPIDLALRYFILKTLQNDTFKANMLVLGANMDNPYASLISGRVLCDDEDFKFNPRAKNTFLQAVSKDIARQFYECKYKFRDLTLLSNYNYISETRDVASNIWSMDEMVLFKFYWYIESRVYDPSTIIKELRYLAKRKEKYANIILGNFYLYGLGVEKDLDKSIEHFFAGKSEPNAAALTGIARVLMEPEHRDEEGAKEALRLSINLNNDSEANYIMFQLTKDDNSDEFDPHNYLRSSAQSGYLPAVYKYALYYADNQYYEASNNALMSVTQYFPKFIELDAAAVDAYLRGEYGRAAMIYLFLAEFNIPTALKNAIFILEKSPRLPNADGLLFSIYKNLAKTQKEYCLNLGDCYYYGKGTGQSFNEAFACYLVSKRVSDESAYNIAYMYENAISVPRNLYHALKTIQKYVTSDSAYLVYYYSLIRISSKILIYNHSYIFTGIVVMFVSFPLAFLLRHR